MSEPRAGRNLAFAIITGLVLAALIFLTLFTSRPAFFVLVAVAVLTAQVELYRALRARGMRPADVLGVTAGLLILVGAYKGGPQALSFGVALSVPAVLIWFVADPNKERSFEGIGATLFGIVWVPFLAAHVIMMSKLDHGAAKTIMFFAAGAFYDIGAFAFGSKFGKHPMASAISPKKTWEGAIGATLLVVVLALLVGPHIASFTAGRALVLALVAAVLAPLGDLGESLVKRDLDVKDMGSVLPGHGGLLDRIDSLVLIAPAAYWLMRSWH